ncbi:DUF305 domain-containing protein [Saccharomonospora sp. NB11]|jgi:uncharacterized protein (DUF305 family)|uniref:DUF305 domain-containing protein n=1 Tax=Saccharomonospora sp. NB11 TaxID=1642298 RepID=UPI0018D16DFD|nr:DUF305 domain-containing protein [Saccharomonospora sp. NB11]
MAAQDRPDAGTSTGTDAPARTAPPTWSRVVIFSAAALAALLVGATIGLVIGQSRGDDPSPVPQAGSVDVGFAQDMSTHHLQAVTMANWARDHSDDPAVRQLAFDIASVQLEQVGRMKGWLMMWGQPEEPLGEPMTWMSGPQGHHHGSGGHTTTEDGRMPGMATEEELATMRSLSGRELDVQFLQLMLRHHQGGVDMAQYGHDHASMPAVRTLAKSMLVSQGAEMDTMRTMLEERGAQPLPFP